MVKYCLPIITNSIEQISLTIEKNLDTYQYFEVWVDYLQDLNENSQQLVTLSKNLKNRLIFNFRRNNLEEIQLQTSVRKNLIKNLSASIIDLDLFANGQDLSTLHPETNLLSSYHNYQKTLPLSELNKILEKMLSFNPQIVKFSCFCNSFEDNLVLLELALNLKKSAKNFIITGMGQNGLLTRIGAQILGNFLAFAPLELEQASAPGQLTLSQFKEIFAILGLK